MKREKKNLKNSFIWTCIVIFFAVGVEIVAPHLLSTDGNLQKEDKKTTTEEEMSVKQSQESEIKEYDLPVEVSEQEETYNDLIDLMKLTSNIYLNADKGKAVNVVLSEDTIYEIQNTVSASGNTVSTIIQYSDMKNYKAMEQFLKSCEKGEEDSFVLYEIYLDGGIGRYHFVFDRKDMYVTVARSVWNENNEPVISTIAKAKVKEWDYTEKGWFCYEVCTPEPPEISEIMDGSRMIRVRPMDTECRLMSEKYVKELGYQGNNLLCSNWDEDHIGELDYNGLYEYFYQMKYGEHFMGEEYPDGIPSKEFESMIMEYLPVTKAQIREYAVFDEKRRTYLWDRLGCFNNVPTFFATSFAEVTHIQKLNEERLILTIDAVCDMIVCNEAIITHELEVAVSDDGSFRYMGNRILNNEEDIPKYYYRLGEKSGQEE